MSQVNNDCEKCGGKCCYMHLISLREDNKDEVEYWTTVGVDKLKDIGSNKTLYYQTLTCQHFKDGLCDIYEDRPKLCKDFPNDKTPSTWRHICPLVNKRKKEDKKILRIF